MPAGRAHDSYGHIRAQSATAPDLGVTVFAFEEKITRYATI